MLWPAANFSFLRTSAFTGSRNEPDALSGKTEVVHSVLPIRTITASLPQRFRFGEEPDLPGNVCR